MVTRRQKSGGLSETLLSEADECVKVTTGPTRIDCRHFLFHIVSPHPTARFHTWPRFQVTFRGKAFQPVTGELQVVGT